MRSPPQDVTLEAFLSCPVPELVPLLSGVWHARSLLRQAFLMPREELEIQSKSDLSPVSRADRESSALLCEALNGAYPQIPIVSEEESLPTLAMRSAWESFFLVDPLDGTKEFLRGSEDFTINIALIQKDRPAWGILDVPMSQTLVVATPEQGVWKLTQSNTTPPQWEPVAKLWRDPLYLQQQEMRAVLSQSHRTGDEQEALEKLQVNNVMRRGSSLKFLLVALQEADVYFRKTPTSEWDTAAGHAILKACGGNVFDETGRELTYNKPSLINGPFFACAESLRAPCLERIQSAYGRSRSANT
jgi:3'(2'), 5'-bisphosphate nucleotidase